MGLPFAFWKADLAVSTDLDFTINTSLGTGASMLIPTYQSGYNYTIFWGDGSSDIGVTGNITHNYASDGIYNLKIIGDFPQFYFNNGGDKLKLTSIDNWGDVNYRTSDQRFAFWGCSNLTTLADDIEWINSALKLTYTFFNCSINSLPDLLTLDSLTSGSNCFYNCNFDCNYFATYHIYSIQTEVQILYRPGSAKPEIAGY
jgi:hypothetical protein